MLLNTKIAIQKFAQIYTQVAKLLVTLVEKKTFFVP